MCISNCRKLTGSIVLAALLVMGMFLLANIPSAHADGRTLFVRPDGAGTACTQASPCALQTALAQAGDGDTIYLAQGTYTGTGAAVITITSSIALYGGWNGAAGGPVVRDPALYPAVLDGEGARRVIGIQGPVTVTLDGLTISNGYTSDRGAGLYSNKASLTIRDTTFYSNVVDSGSTANTFGGGAYIEDGSLHLHASAFRANDAWCSGCPFTKGGGLSIFIAPSIIEDCLFEANDAWQGSGMSFDGGVPLPLRIYHTIFRENGLGKSPGSGHGGYGGAVHIGQALAQVDDSLFILNRASNEGGALFFGSRELSLNSSIIVHNTSFNVPAISIWNARPFTMTNNIIADNQPGRGTSAAVVTNSSTGTLVHNTIARNINQSAEGCGVELRSGGPLTLTNTILVSHTIGIIASAGTTATLEATLWGIGPWANGVDWAGAGTVITGLVNIWGNPRFLNPAGGNYHLGPGSAAVDAGVDAGVTTDMDGDPRPIGAGFDIGADEYRPCAYTYLPLILRRR